jgi:hypothetical protein
MTNEASKRQPLKSPHRLGKLGVLNSIALCAASTKATSQFRSKQPACPMPPHISIRPIQPADFAAWKPLLRATTPSMAAQAPPPCLIRSRKPLSTFSLQRFFEKDAPVHAFVASLQTPEGEPLVGLVHDLFHRSTTRLNHVCYLQDLIAQPLPRASRPAAASTGPPKPPTPAAALPATNSPSMRGLLCIRMSFRRSPCVFHVTCILLRGVPCHLRQIWL